MSQKLDRRLAKLAEQLALRGVRPNGEVLRLEVGDIDSKRMLLCIRDGKTGGRCVPMSPL